MEDICQNLFGKSIGPNTTPVLNEYAGSVLEESRFSGKACFVVGIWDYPDTSLYQWQLESMYTSIEDCMYYVYSWGSYDYVKTLTNSDATHSNVYQWLTWLCASYDYVDVYFIGHGFEGSNGLYGYCCYDGIDSYGNMYYYNFYYADELASGNAGIHGYNYSTLRLGVGGFCHSGAFTDVFLNEGDVWIGSEISNGGDWPKGTPMGLYTDYAVGYFSDWGYYWYFQDVGSYAAHNYSDSAGVISFGLPRVFIAGFEHYPVSGTTVYP